MKSKPIAAQIYYGVPQKAMQVFRATKAPSTILLAGVIGVPIFAALVLTISAVAFQSPLPLNLFVVGFLQFRLDGNPAEMATLPPNMAHLLQTMTPAQQQLGRDVFQLFTLYVTILAFAVLWFIWRFIKFLAKEAIKPK
jgi:hypothetical protein